MAYSCTSPAAPAAQDISASTPLTLVALKRGVVSEAGQRTWAASRRQSKQRLHMRDTSSHSAPAWRKGRTVHEERTDPETVMETLSSKRVEQKVQRLYTKASGWEVATSSHAAKKNPVSADGKENDAGQALAAYFLNTMSLKNAS